MLTTDAQVRKLMEEMAKHGQVGLASAKAGMDRKTGSKYVAAGRLPSELKQPRTWRTREDPFAQDWPLIADRLREAPELEAKTIFELLLSEHPDKYEPGQLRTLQRHVRDWRATEGPDKEIFFAQVHRPGEAMQTDFTNANELEVTICREAFPHLLCHPVLPYSNWEWATVAHSESLAAIRRGVQAALFMLGKVPVWHQTDNSTAATHDLRTGKRGFNDEYVVVMQHFDMKPRTIAIGESNQNGDVEALNGALKRRLKQHLLVRGSRDFDSVGDYEGWVQAVLEKANRLRAERVVEELAAMRPLKVARLAEYKELDVPVTSWSTIRVLHNAYSVPSRLKNERVRVRAYEDRLEVFYGGSHQMSVDRLRGRNGHRINYRHIIWSLVQKPGAFAQYKYREDLFPTPAFREAYDGFLAIHGQRNADIEYLRVLHLAASTMESDVQAALELLLRDGNLRGADQVKSLVAPAKAEVPELSEPVVDLKSYDALLEAEQEVAS